MEYRKFGKLDFDVSVIAFGGAAISGEGGGYGFGEISEDDAKSLLHLAFELGINIFDTAPIYGYGLSEKRIGRAFRGGLSDKVFIVSKSGVSWHENRRVNMSNDPKITRMMLEQSLRDLQRDYIDLYMIHWPDSNVDIRRSMEELAKAKYEGKIHAIGLCNTYPEDYERACEIERVDVLQAEMNLFSEYTQDVLLDLVDRDDLGLMSWGSLDRGIITGRVTRERQKKNEYDKTDLRSWAPWWKQNMKKSEWKFQAMDEINLVLKQDQHTGTELALGYLLSYPELSTAICGPKTHKQLEELVRSLDHLPSDDLIHKCAHIPERFRSQNLS